MKHVVRLTSIFIITLMLLVAIPRAEASDVAGIVKSAVNSIIAIVKDPSLKGDHKVVERRTKLKNTISDLFSFEEMAKRSLGKHWKERSGEERKEFTEVFSKLVETSYIKKIEKYTDEEVVYSDVKVKDEVAIVKTRIVKKDGGVIPISYKMVQREEGGWQVYDVVIVGVSLVRNYRVRFSNVLSKSSYEEFLALLKAKAEAA